MEGIDEEKKMIRWDMNWKEEKWRKETLEGLMTWKNGMR